MGLVKEGRDLKAIGTFSFPFSCFPSLNDALEIMPDTRALRLKERVTFCATGNMQTLEAIPSIPRPDGEQGPEDGAESV